MSSPHLHVFVCTNRRPQGSRPACGHRGADDLVRALASGIAERPALRGHVRLTPCECLGPCFDGPSVVVYPAGVWYGGVTEADVSAILDEHLVGGQPVDRLLLDLDDED